MNTATASQLLRTTLALLALLTAAPAQAQITITRADFEGRISELNTTSYVYTATNPEVLGDLLALRGGGLTFDFRDASFEVDTLESEGAQEGACPSELPGCEDEDLNTANLIYYVETDTAGTVAIFQDLLDDGLYFRGLGVVDLEGEMGLTKFVPRDLVYRLPLTFGTTWESDYAIESVPSAPGFEMSVESDHEVVGWGTLITPSGSADALMSWERDISTTVVGEMTFEDTTYTVEFITRGEVSASITHDGAGTVLDASYVVLEGGGTAAEPGAGAGALTLHESHPNPTAGRAEVAFTLAHPAEVTLVVYDVLGRRVATLAEGPRPAGTHEAVWDTRGLPSGAYFYRLQAGAEAVTRSLQVVR